MNEEWRTIPNFPPSIEVSSSGRVRKYVTDSETIELSQHRYNNQMWVNFQSNSYQVHRLVASAFISNPKGYKVVKHKNSDNLDNRAENLIWSTNSDNFNSDYGSQFNARKKVYCKELDTVFGSLRSAAFCTHLPQDIISESIRRGITIAGCTFRLIDADDELVKTHKVIYVSFEKMIEILQNVNCYSMQCIDSALSSELQ